MLPYRRNAASSNDACRENPYSNSGGSAELLPQMETKGSPQWFTSGSRVAFHISVLIYLGASIAFVPVLFFVIAYVVVGDITEGICGPEGKFQLRDIDDLLYSLSVLSMRPTSALMSQYSIVTITIGFGRVNFNQAKLTDAAWDIAVGRVGQVMLAYQSYKVLIGSLLSTMETTPIPHRLFAELSSGASSGWAVLRIVTLASSSQLWKVWKLRLFLMAFASTYVLVFPSLVSLMTGYTTTYTEFMAIDGDLIAFNETSFSLVYYVINDGQKIGLPDNSHVWMQWDSESSTISACGIVETNDVFQDASGGDLESEVTRHYLSCHNTLEGVDSQAGEDCNVFAWPNGTKTTISSIPESDSFAISLVLDDEDLYVYRGQMYNRSYFETNGKCQPTDKYYWGFSFTLLSVCAILNLLWVLAMYGLWITSSRSIGTQADYGPYRAAMDLATIGKEACGEDLKTMSNSEVIKKLDEGNAGMVLAELGAEPVLWDRRVFYRKKARAPRWRNGLLLFKQYVRNVRGER